MMSTCSEKSETKDFYVPGEMNVGKKNVVINDTQEDR